MPFRAGNPQDCIHSINAVKPLTATALYPIPRPSADKGVHPHLPDAPFREVVGIFPAATSTPYKHIWEHSFHPLFPVSAPSCSTRAPQCIPRTLWTHPCKRPSHKAQHRGRSLVWMWYLHAGLLRAQTGKTLARP